MGALGTLINGWSIGVFLLPARFWGNLEKALRGYWHQLHFISHERIIFICLKKQSVQTIGIAEEIEEKEGSPTEEYPTEDLTTWFTKTENWSSDGYNRIIVSGYQNDKLSILEMDSLLKLSWYWIASSSNYKLANNQPPIISKSGITYVLTEKSLLAFKSGQLVWELKNSDDPFQYAVVSGDESLFVTRGNELLHVSKDGKEIGKNTFEDRISGAPLITFSGTIYVATTKKLYKMK